MCLKLTDAILVLLLPLICFGREYCLVLLAEVNHRLQVVLDESIPSLLLL